MIRCPQETPPAPGQAIQIAPGVMWLRFPLPMALDHVNVFAFDDPDGWTIIDTGLDTKASRQMWQDVLQGPLAGKPHLAEDGGKKWAICFFGFGCEDEDEIEVVAQEFQIWEGGGGVDRHPSATAR